MNKNNDEITSSMHFKISANNGNKNAMYQYGLLLLQSNKIEEDEKKGS